MRRREFIITALANSAAWSLAARAEEAAKPVVGFLSSRSEAARSVAAFRQGLREAGFVEGQNVAVEYRYADNHYERLPAWLLIWCIAKSA